ncbi:MAG: hypothetical protein KAI47_02410, partial [Deltaproteobacteria bacterium]|nr:hypothetical protein [Deltaproteobacteria bacterium]
MQRPSTTLILAIFASVLLITACGEEPNRSSHQVTLYGNNSASADDPDGQEGQCIKVCSQVATSPTNPGQTTDKNAGSGQADESDPKNAGSEQADESDPKNAGSGQ